MADDKKPKTEDLDKGVKEGALAIALGAAQIMTPNHIHRPVEQYQAAQPSPKEIQRVEKIDFHPDLEHIAFIESSSGKNKNHETTNIGLNAGHTAGGATGLMPIMVKETLDKNPELAKKYSHLLTAQHDQITSAINNNENMEAEIANAHWNRLHETFQGNRSKMAYAWRNGITAAKRASTDEVYAHPYVQKYLAHAASRKIASLTKSKYVDFNQIFEELERDRALGILSEKVLGKSLTVGHHYGPPTQAVGGAALVAESISPEISETFGRLKRKLKKKKKKRLEKAIDEIEELENLAKGRVKEHHLEKSPKIIEDGDGEWTHSRLQDSTMHSDIKVHSSKEIEPGLWHHHFSVNHGTSSGDRHYHQLSDSKDPLEYPRASASGYVDKKSGHLQIDTAAVDPEHQGKGYGKTVHKLAAIKHGGILSDTHVTAGENGVFHSLGKDPSINAKLSTGKNPHHLTIKNSTGDRLMTALGKVEKHLAKMSRPKITFPNFKKLSTRPDQDVQLLETGRQKDLYGQKVANAALADIKPGKTFRLSGSRKVHTKESAVKAYGDRVASRFDRNTLGTSADTPQGPKSAALAGKLRSKFEEGDDNYKNKLETHKANRSTMIKQYNQSLFDWYDKARDLSRRLDEPGVREEYNQHLTSRPSRPKIPRAPSKSRKATTDLSPDKAKERGRAVDATINHEALHHTMAEMERHYGKDAQRKTEDALLSHFDPAALTAVGNFISTRMRYDPKSTKFNEEILAHSRDILTNPAKREHFKTFVGTDNFEKHIKALKQGHQKAYEYAMKLKPSDVGGKDE